MLPDRTHNSLYFRPLIPLTVSMLIGIVLGTVCPGYFSWAGIAAAGSMAVMIWDILRNQNETVPPWVLFLSLGYLSIQGWVMPQLPSDHVIHHADTQSYQVIGVIRERPIQHENCLKFDLQAQRLIHQNSEIPVCGMIRVTVLEPPPSLSFGQQIAFSSRIRTIRNFNNPGGFDYKRYLAFQGIWVSAFTRGDKIEILLSTSESGFRAWIESVRTAISSLIDQHIVGTDEKALLKAFIVGVRDEIAPPLRDKFARTGLGHLIAISGLHMVIVAGAAFTAFRFLLCRSQWLLWKAWVNKGAAALSLIPILVYGMIAGMSPPTERAVIMGTVFLMRYWFEREYEVINAMMFAALMIVIWHPPSLFSASFQLSYAAVFWICLGMSKFPIEYSSGQGIWALCRYHVVSLFAMTLFATLGTSPLTLYYFNQFAPVGIITNLIIVPLLGIAAVYIELFALMVYPLYLPIAADAIRLAGELIGFSLKLITFFSELPGASFKSFTPSWIEISAYYGLTAAALTLFSPVSRSPRQKKLSAVAAVIAVLIGVTDTMYWLYQRFWHSDLRVTFLDMGQGSCALLELPGAYCMLADGGTSVSSCKGFDAGASVIAPFLWHKKIHTVDAVVLSHPDTDHLNGLPYILKHFKVKTVWTNHQTQDTVICKEFIQQIRENQIVLPEFRTRTWTINGVTLSILYPPDDFMKRSDPWRDENNNSLVLRVQFKDISFLFPGDIQARAEKELIETAGDRLKSTILLSPHHGSSASNTTEFLDCVRPERMVFSVGKMNPFGFPKEEVLQRCSERGIAIDRTDIHGAISMTTDGYGVILDAGKE